MKRFACIMLLSALCSILFFAPRINMAKADGTIYVRADGSVDPPTTNITTLDNITYIFTDNIYDEIVVERDNIVVDGAGYTLEGMGSGWGINLTERNNVTIKNVEIIAFGGGILVYFSSFVTITGNTLPPSGGLGIWLCGSHNNTILGNQIVDMLEEFGSGGTAVSLGDSSYNLISGNNLSNNGGGLSLSSRSNNNAIHENIITGNNMGISAYGPWTLYNTISGNNITHNLEGIVIQASSNNHFISGNNIENNKYGIYHERSSWSIFSENTIANNDYGVRFLEIYGNKFYHNDFINNTLHVKDRSTENSDYGPSANIWDDSYPTGGNYWSGHTSDDEYSGPYQNETYRDGIGETAYVIDENNRDHYPLVNPWSAHLNPPIAHFTYTPTIPAVREGATFNVSSSFDLDEDIASYLWDFDDGNTTSISNSTIVHAFGFPRTYNVTVTAIDSKGFNSSYSQTVWARMITFASVSTSSASTFVGFMVNITGTLRDMFGNCLKNETVVLYYTFSGISTWTPITSDTTDNLGNYQAMWIPPATGSFMVKVEWTGNSTFVGTHNTTNLNTLSFEDEYIFSVESNSTVSSLTFNAENMKLSFTVSGPSDTKGYVKVTIAKSLVEDISDVKVKLNDEQINYTVTSSDDSWLLHFTYLHSTHEVTISLGNIPIPFIETPIGRVSTYLVVIIGMVVLIALYIASKKRVNRTHTTGISAYEDYWASLQMGKWRAKAAQKIFSFQITLLLVTTVFVYIGIASSLITLPQYIPELSDVDLLTPISAILGIAVAMLGIKLGFENYFIQQRAGPEVITYCGIVEYQKARGLVTFINKGKTVAIRNISLLAVKDKKRFLDFPLSGFPSIEIFATATLFQGWRLLGDGKSCGVLEKDIKRAMNEITFKLKDTKEVGNLYIAIMAFDEEFNITHQASLSETLLAGCKLGGYSELAEYATDEKGSFPGLLSGVKTYIEILKHPHEGRIGEPIPAKMIGEVPPNVVDMDFEILAKLDSIEKHLGRMVEEDKKKRKRRKKNRRNTRS